ncbi:putative protein kinase IRE1 family [Helianthus annuus]|nr:putative protein kinase IRE1 family [Helianthus annuus]KAJ0916578.1 putative protein kinase IRE1 family [Helianthus annuus]
METKVEENKADRALAAVSDRDGGGFLYLLLRLYVHRFVEVVIYLQVCSHSCLVSNSPSGLRKIGKLLVFDKEIWKGSNCMIILEGVYDGRPVAMKRILKSHNDVVLKEIQNLIVSNHHPNIVRWYGVEYDEDFVYIVLERCVCSLHDLILSQNNSTVQDFKLWKPNGYPSHELLKVMRLVIFV